MLSLGAFAVLFHGGGPDGFAVERDAQPASARSRPLPESWAPAPDWVSSSRSGRGSDSSRRRCTARSPATPSGSSRAPPCSASSASACSTSSSRGWRSPGPAHSSPSTSRRTPAPQATSSSDPCASTYGDWAITMFNILLCHRILRLRHGVPQLRIALPLCAWPGGPFEGPAEDPRRDASQARLAAHRVVGADRNHVGAHPGVPRRRHGSVRAPVHAAGHSRDHGDPDRAVAVRVRGDRLTSTSTRTTRAARTGSRRSSPLCSAVSACFTSSTCCGSTRRPQLAPRSGTLLFKLTPWIVVGLFVLGAALATYFKFRDPRRYELIGRIIYDETEVRE